MVPADHPRVERLGEIVGSGGERRERGRTRLHDDEGIRHGRIVELAARGVAADRVHVHARRQPLAPDDRVDGVRGGAGDVRTLQRLGVGTHRENRRLELARQLVRQRARRCRITSRHANLAQPAHPWDQPSVRSSLHAGSEHRHPGGVRPRQQPGGQRRPGGGAHGGDVGAVHDRHRLTARGIEGADHRLVRGTRAAGVLRKDRHQLAGQRLARRAVRDHGREHGVPILDHRCEAVRHGRAPSAQILHGGRERLDQLAEIQQRLDVGAAQYEHRSLSPQPTIATRTAPAR